MYKVTPQYKLHKYPLGRKCSCLYVLLQVNELRDSATQIEEEIDKTKNSMHQNKMEVARLKGQLERLDPKDPKYVSLEQEPVCSLHVC